MGGCRCSFRDCKTNTYKSRRMHFFRFPLKSLERYKKWREYAKTEKMLSYTEVKRQNMVICARHFRSECFMNYKMDRLTLLAIPTLMRLSTTRALDFEQDMDNGVLVTVEAPKQKHLIAPENFECPLDLDTDEDLFERLKELESERTVADADEDEYANASLCSYSIVEINSQDVASEVINYGRVEEKPLKSSSNMVEILETIQVPASHLKRPRIETEETICKKRILNSHHNVDKKPVHTVVVPFTEESSEPAPGYEVGEVENITTLVTNELIEQEGNPIFGQDVFNNDEDDDDNNVEFIEIHNDENKLQEDFETNENNTTIVQLKADCRQEHLTTLETKNLADQQEIDVFKKQYTELEILKIKISILENENLELKETFEKNEDIKKQLLSCQLENARLKNSSKDIEILKAELQKCKKECDILNETSLKCNSLKSDILFRDKKIQELVKIVRSYIDSNLKEKTLKEQIELKLNEEQEKHLQTKTKLLQQISALEQSLELSRTQITSTKNNTSLYKSNINDLQLEKLNLSKQKMEIEQSLQTLQNSYDTLNQEHLNLKVSKDCLQQKHSNLEQQYWKLEALQNQVATVTTSLKNIPNACSPSQISQTSTNSLTKAQLFNAIKRYVSASMVSLLRMEMFGSSEREWKSDERQVSVDLLRLGENVYNYLTDEWRFRLPALHDVRNWLSQLIVMDDEDDL